MIEKILGQEWCDPKDIQLKGSGYITIGTPDGLLVLCNKTKYKNETHSGIRYIPLRKTDLHFAEE